MPVLTASVEQVLGMLSGVESRGQDSWMAICPAHSDVGASLSIKRGDRQAVVLYCHAGCSYEDVVTALPGTLADANGHRRNGASPAIAAPAPPPKACNTGRPKDTPRPGRVDASGVTLDALAAHLRLPREFLEGLGWRESKRGGVVLSYFDEAGQELYRKMRVRLSGAGDKYRHVKAKGAPQAKQLSPFGLWRLPDYREKGRHGLVLVEGETDPATLWHHGCPALGIPGASNASCLAGSHLVGFDRVFVVREPDKGGETFLAGVGARLRELGYAGQVYEVRMPDGAKDPAELHQLDPANFSARFRSACESAEPVAGPSVEGMFDTLADVKGRPVEFLWPPYLVARELNILMASPGDGKGFVVSGLVAAVTRGGGDIPGGLGSNQPADALLWSREDEAETVLKARLSLAGADLSRVRAFRFRENEFGFGPEALSVIAQAIQRFRPALVVFDPIVSFIGEGVDMHRSNTVRAVLQPLADIMRRGKATCVLVAHCRKGEVRKALDALFGSIDFAAIVRSALGVYRDPHRPSGGGVTRGTIAHAKHNLSLTGPSLRFEIHDTPTEEFGRVGAFRWAGEVDATADELAALTGGSTDERAGLADAVDLLRELLGDGSEVPASDIQRIAREKTGISYSTLYRAKRQLGVFDRRDGYQGRVFWFFPREGEQKGDRQESVDSALPGTNRGPAPF